VEREPQSARSEDRLKLVDIAVDLTGIDEDECVVVRLADHRHFLHSTTARALSEKLIKQEGRAVLIRIHGIEHTAGRNASRALGQALQRRLSEWNRVNAGSPGWTTV
jgi:hypothetical protein